MWQRPLRLAMLGVGIALIGYTAAGLFRNRIFLLDAVAADGIVVATAPGRLSAAAPVIRFPTADGAVVDWVSRDAGGAAALAVGEHVPVLYMPDAPGRAMIGRLRDIFGIFLLTGGVGVILIVLGLRARLPERARLKRGGR